MSWQATAWAVRQKAGNPGAKLVLLVIANYADENGECWPSIERLAEETEQGESTIRRHLAGLKSAGLLAWERQRRSDGSLSVNRYSLPLDLSTTTARFEHHHRSNRAAPALKTDAHHRSPVSAQEEPSLEPSSIPAHAQPDAQRDAQMRMRTSRTAHDDDFETWWKSYPRRVDKGRARKAYATAAKKAPVEQLLAAAINYAASRAGQDPKFTKHPTTWLNAESWLDEPEPAQQRRIPGMSVWGDDIATPPPGHIEGMGVWDL